MFRADNIKATHVRANPDHPIAAGSILVSLMLMEPYANITTPVMHIASISQFILLFLSYSEFCGEQIVDCVIVDVKAP